MTTPARHRPQRPLLPRSDRDGSSPRLEAATQPKPVRPWTVLLFCCLLLAPLASGAAPDARELLNAGRADEALSLLNRASDPDAETYNDLCRVYYSLEEWDSAVRNCERAIKFEPRNAIFQLWLGRSYGEKANVSKNLVLAYMLARKTVAAFATAHQLDRHNIAISRDLAEYYTTAPAIVGGSLDKAGSLAAEISQEHPSDAAWIRAMAAASAGRQEEAEHEYTEAIRLEHDSAAAYLDFAHYLRSRKDWERFQETVERAMQSATIQPADRYNAAEMLLRTDRDLEGAARILRAYIHGDHTDEGEPVFRAHYLLGEALLKMGDTGQAAAEYRAALALASSYRPAAQALRRLGQ